MTTVLVPGQAPATDQALAEGMPTEQELARTVVSLPKTVNGKLIGRSSSSSSPSTDQPAMTAGHVIKFSIQHAPKPSLWSKLFSFQETYSIFDDAAASSPPEPFAGGLYIREFKNPLWLTGRRFVLFDHHDQPLVEATHDRSKPLQRVYTIQGREPLHASDEPLHTSTTTSTSTSTTNTESDEPMKSIAWYPWFKMFDIDDSHLNFRSLQVWNGKNYQPMMRVEPVERQAKNKGVQETLPPKKWQHLVVDSSSSSSSSTDAAAKDDKSQKKRIVYAALAKQHGEWKACLAPGTDVVAMLMVTALLDDMVGWFA